jgi:hypothetical protein
MIPAAKPFIEMDSFYVQRLRPGNTDMGKADFTSPVFHPCGGVIGFHNESPRFSVGSVFIVAQKNK